MYKVCTRRRLKSQGALCRKICFKLARIFNLGLPLRWLSFLIIVHLQSLFHCISVCLFFSNPVKRFPLLGGRELDLYHLYLKVKSLGGSKRITQDRLWGDVARSFNLPASVTSASYACRQNFIK